MAAGDRILTAPGYPLEMEEAVLCGRRVRVWKHVNFDVSPSPSQAHGLQVAPDIPGVPAGLARQVFEQDIPVFALSPCS